MLRRSLIPILLALVVAMPSGCASARQTSDKADKDSVGTKPMNITQAEQAGMRIVWQASLSGMAPTPDNPKKLKKYEAQVRDVYLYDEYILVETVDKFLFSFDRKTGDSMWVSPLPDQMQIVPTLYDRKFYTICAGRLTTIDYKGVVSIGNTFTTSPSAPLTMDASYFYVASTTPEGGGLFKLDKQQLQPVWPAPARAEGIILGQPILTEELMVLFSTSKGEVAGIDSITSGRRIDLTGFGSILAGLTADTANFYFAAGDYYIYSYTLLGTPKWRTLLGDRPAGAPVIAGDTIYQDSMDGGLWALSKADGSMIWHNPGSFVTADWFAAAEPQDDAIIAKLRAGTSVEGYAWYPYAAAARREAAKRGEKLPEGVLVITTGNPPATGEMLSKAVADKDQTGKPVVHLLMNSSGSDRYAKILADHPGAPIAIVLNNEVFDLVAVTKEKNAVKQQLQVTVGNLADKDDAKKMAEEINTAIVNTPQIVESKSFLSYGDTNVLRLAPGRQIWNLDASSGRVMGRMDVSMYSRAPRNIYGDGLIYLITNDGLISCLAAK
jgi:outer membrane protein assembly factor BamB